MDRSPKGREIENVEGNPGDIISRGRAIRSLGTKMLDCADTLETIKNESVGDGSQKGKAIEELKDSIGDSYEKLREAGNLYQPVGPVITAYGHALGDAQPVINNSAEACTEKWAIFQGLPGDENGTTNPEDVFDFAALAGGNDDGPTDAQKTAAANNAAKQAAYEDWRESAEEFDGGYDTWEDAFDTAVDGVEDELSGSIKDSFWDNISSTVAVLTEVLSWAALIVGVIAIFCTGFLLLAAVLAVAAFLLTAIQYKAGDKSGFDLAMAGLAIIPVGKITNLTKLLQFPKLARGVGGFSNAVSRTWKGLSKGPLYTIFTRGGDDAYAFRSRTKILENLIGPTMKSARRDNISLYIGNYTLLQQNLTSVRVFSGVDWVSKVGGTWAGHYGRAETTFGAPSIIPKPVGRALG